MTRTATQVLLVSLLLSCFCFLSLSQIFHDGATCDEPVHLSAGYSYWITNDYRLNPEHPPFAKRLAALPLLLLPYLNRNCDPSRIFLGNGKTAQLAKQDWVRALATGSPTFEFSFGQFFLFGYTDKAMDAFHNAACRTCTKLTHDFFLNDADLLLRAARISLLAFPLFLGTLVFLWSRQLWGLGGALLSLSLLAFDPNFIAYSGLVLTDVPVACLFFATIYFFCRFSQRATISDAIFTCSFFAFSVASKYSAVLLAPVMLCLAVVNCLRKSPWTFATGKEEKPLAGRWRAATMAALLLAAALSGYILIWAQYSFRFSPAADLKQAAAEQAILAPGERGAHPARPGYFPLVNSLIATETLANLAKKYPDGHVDYENKPLNWLNLFEDADVRAATPSTPQTFFSHTLLWLSDRHLLPQAFLYGLSFVREYSVFRRAYLFGELSVHSFPSYFIWTFLLKSTTIFLLLLVCTLLVLATQRKLWRFELLYLLVPATIYFGVALLSGLNLGQRHLMPVYPFLFVLVGALCKVEIPALSATKARLALACLIAAIAVSSTVVLAPITRPTIVYPDYISYFNEFAGGPQHGWESLLDSNLEYGQSLKYVADWLNNHHVERPVYLCYPGGDDPTFEGIRHIQVTGGLCYEPVLDLRQIKGPGHLVISISKIVGLNQSPKLTRLWNQFVHDHCTLEDVVDHCIYIFRIDEDAGRTATSPGGGGILPANALSKPH